MVAVVSMSHLNRTMVSMCPLPCAVLMVSMCHSNCVPPMASMRRSLGILGIHGLDTMETNGSMESKEIKTSMESLESVSPWIVFKESMDSNQSLEYNQHRVKLPGRTWGHAGPGEPDLSATQGFLGPTRRL